jgi:hypothetical protein
MNLGLSEFTQIKGYKEYVRYANGNVSENIIDYPNPNGHYRLNAFTHKMFTKGVIITHPLITSKIQRSLLAALLYETFLSDSAFERSDIEYCSGVLNTDIGGIKSNTSFITIYDKIIGGLNITSRLMNPKELRNGFRMMVDLIDNGLEQDILGVALNQQTKDAIHVMYDDLINNNSVNLGDAKVSEFVVARGSKALYLIDKDSNLTEEVIVDDVVFDNIKKEFKYYVTYVNDSSVSVDDVEEGSIIAISGVSYKGKLRGVRVINTNDLW